MLILWKIGNRTQTYLTHTSMAINWGQNVTKFNLGSKHLKGTYINSIYFEKRILYNILKSKYY